MTLIRLLVRRIPYGHRAFWLIGFEECCAETGSIHHRIALRAGVRAKSGDDLILTSRDTPRSSRVVVPRGRQSHEAGEDLPPSIFGCAVATEAILKRERRREMAIDSSQVKMDCHNIQAQSAQKRLPQKSSFFFLSLAISTEDAG